ncbi:plasmid mobilization protein [Desulfovibrio litoralis]|uniref:Mobilisation protein (MobC) n=1 Tax=Desulfovibrio litoralis DSM 11393 TaxID=1121455 RepID=A0A1M7TL31_9BACT|nr:hypothetical protein [Desulfovibrio litoralis]SHN71415.1 hypothetical protein SAMN02745728_02182 [Desulfovibrio litoralis DSM 11393]
MKKYKTKGGRGGRPQLQNDLVRIHTVGIRLNSAELDSLKRKADSFGLPLGQWLRNIALKHFVPRPLVPEINRTVYAELANLASNLNQIAKASYSSSVAMPTHLICQTNNKLHLLRLELLGIKNDSKTD